jgi:hypothetical protein
MNRIGRYVRPGIHFIEKDTSGVEYSKRYLRKIKIGKIFDIDVPNVVVDSFKSKWGTKIESQLHRRFNKFKINGEWFKLNDEQVKSFNNECQLIHDGLEIISTQNTYYLDRGNF